MYNNRCDVNKGYTVKILVCCKSGVKPLEK